ncbi:MAG TPA: hypothetical protein VJI13_06765 [Candidatus Norongarragalinales archaeon]|nr:hypothetical protein [Candidatus Norongarragalinales archaeon]
MSRFRNFALVAILACVLIAGCIDELRGKGSASPSAFADATTSPTPAPIPTARIPADFLTDDLDTSIAELEIVG